MLKEVKISGMDCIKSCSSYIADELQQKCPFVALKGVGYGL